jgi:hypothetical protein
MTVLIDGIELFNPLLELSVFLELKKGRVFFTERQGRDPEGRTEQE